MSGRKKVIASLRCCRGGKTLLLTIGDGRFQFLGKASIAVLLLETGEYRVILEGGASARYCPLGHLVYARGGLCSPCPSTSSKSMVMGAPVEVVEPFGHLAGCYGTSSIASHFIAQWNVAVKVVSDALWKVPASSSQPERPRCRRPQRHP